MASARRPMDDARLCRGLLVPSRMARMQTAIVLISFQVAMTIAGNMSFLNWLANLLLAACMQTFKFVCVRGICAGYRRRRVCSGKTLHRA